MQGLHDGSPPRVWGMPIPARTPGRRRRFTPTCVGNAPSRPAATARSTVHPHVCGECAWKATPIYGIRGSPPRVWGMPLRDHCQWPRFRFTPTCVGNATARRGSRRTTAVHPHVCGECNGGGTILTFASGSPPRVWGMQLREFLHVHVVRFTPTCVGNARASCASRCRPPVHPHVCGECAVTDPRSGGAVGSPPRVWGMPAAQQPHHPRARFTPTCVGNARNGTRRPGRGSVHPHVCGECKSRGGKIRGIRGSPPRVWGMLPQLAESCPESRFTPTCVGNASPSHSDRCTPPVHPHVCGECILVFTLPLAWYGSPPRVWGMQVLGGCLHEQFRFTPTCVGNALSATPSRAAFSVHPHVCGECRARRDLHHIALGSPPRVWGMPNDGPRLHGGERFTPTCVGNATGRPRGRRRTSVHPHVCGECVEFRKRGIVERGSPPRVWGMLAIRRPPHEPDRFTPTCVGNAGRCGRR